MSETPSENPNQVVQPGAEDAGTGEAAPTPQEQPQQQTTAASEETFAFRLVKQETGVTHWNVAKGLWETVTHADTGEPDAEYVLLATIDGVDVKLAAWNAGRVETIVRAQRQAQQQSGQ